jgi:diguanylate cyclase (GGDEF)-like protein/PAS domain S-box-containing protein
LKYNDLHDQLFSNPINPGIAAWAPWRRYAVALALVACATLIRLYLLPQGLEYAYLPFYLAVLLAGMLQGSGPIAFAAAISLCAGDYFFDTSRGWFDAERELPTAIFILYCVVVYLLRRRAVHDGTRARASRLLLESIFESNPDALLILDTDRVIVMANRQAAVLLGYEHGELNGRNFKELLPDRLRSGHVLSQPGAGNKADSQSGDEPQENLVLRKDGQEVEVEINVKPVRTEHGSLIACTLRDVRTRNRTEAELRISAAAFESNDGIVVTDAKGAIQRVNQAFTRISGFGMADLVGRTTDMLRSSRHGPEFYNAIADGMRASGGWQGEIWAKRKNGEEYPAWLNISVVHDKDGKVTHYVASQADITERKQAEAEIKDLAFFDQLTGLPNRTLFGDRLQQAIRSADRSSSHGVLLLIDLDNFKELNDTMGHDIGDKLLRQVAKRLLSLAREVDTVARLGGDEFVVILRDLSKDAHDAANLAEVEAEKVLDTLREPYRLGEVTYTSTASIGATLFRDKSNAFEEVMKQADLAMYKSKAVGRNTVRFFDPAMEAAILERARLESDLRLGLVQDTFVLYYQPQVAATGRLLGAEALIRLRHPQRGIVSPVDFIQVAEESGLILPIGAWVLKTACVQLAQWAKDSNKQSLTLAVNVSVSQFRQQGFVQQVIDALESTGANPMRLKLELTESLLVDDLPTVIEKMNALKRRGVCFSLDDFGTGYSSLAYLKRLPLDQLKIDQSFVRDVLTDQSDATIAKTIVALANSLGLSVIAEGVENEAQREFLVQNGCYNYQGFLFAPPLPIEEFEHFPTNSGF